MPSLIAAVVLVTVLCLANLLLTFDVVRRLRARGGPGHGGHDADVADPVLPVGATVPAFTAVTIAGETVSRDGLGAVLFGFFAPGCPACAERLPLFVKAARKAAGEGRRVLAVVHGDEADTCEQVAAPTAVARVVVEPADGPLGRGFAVAGYPVFGLPDANGRVTRAVSTRKPFPHRCAPRPDMTDSAGRGWIPTGSFIRMRDSRA